MLSNLHIENVAVVLKADIAFGAGFNVLTGETGAGKSIIIDAINMVTGEKTSKDLIRRGADSAFVSAQFTGLSPAVEEVLGEFGVKTEEDGSLLLQRELSLSGRSVCRVNARPVPASVLREVAYHLINIHGQNDNQALLQSERHILFLDRFAGIEDDLARYQEQYRTVHTLAGKLAGFFANQKDLARKIDLYTYQSAELTRAALKAGEEEELLARRAILANAEKILSAINETREVLYDGSEEAPGARDRISQALSALQPVTRLDDDFAKTYDKLSEILYGIEDCVDVLRQKGEELDFGAGDLDEIEARLDILSRLKRKYAMTVEELLTYQKTVEAELEELNLGDEAAEKLNAQLNEEKQRLAYLASGLTEKRKAAASRFEQAVLEELAFLDMAKVRFEVAVTPVPEGEFTLKGADKVEFLLCANAGEEVKPLSKTASGGELSRIMLALKNVLNREDEVGTLIFDEIDSGISGRAANKVAQKLFMVSCHHQVLCVTHLVQIASYADEHFLIAKTSDETSTRTTVTPLKAQERAGELARIIAASEITDLTLQNAREMLALSQKYKEEKLEELTHGSL